MAKKRAGQGLGAGFPINRSADERRMPLKSRATPRQARPMKPVRALTLIAGHVSDEILLRNEYLAAENEILRSKLGKRVELRDSERIRLAKLGKRMGKRASRVFRRS